MRSTIVHSIQLQNILLRIRRKHTQYGLRHSVKISRLYRDGDTIRQSTRFSRNDLPILRAALDEAFTWILENKSSTPSH